MRLLLAVIFLSSPLAAHPLPGLPTFDEVELPADTSGKRIDLIKLALQSASEFKLNKYIYGSADPKRGGFDCSGSMFYLLQKVGVDPARSSGAQYDWIEKAGNLVVIPADTRSLEAPVFDKLQPGDLLFWSGTYQPTDGRTNKITHVQMYVGKLKADGRHIMIGSTDGRSYGGNPRTGFGVFDFKIPRPKSKSRFAAYGTPPGLVDR